MPQSPTSRRRFLRHVLVAAAVAPLLGESGRALGAPLPKLTSANVQAKALKYVDDASKTQDPAHKGGSVCLNCQFFTAGTNACALFAGFQVAPKGWCVAWAKKA